MKTTRILLSLLATFAFLGEADCFGQTIVWNGGGDGTSWSNAQNWVGGQTPGLTNNAVITNGAGTNVVISSAVSVKSIVCNKALVISNSLTVTAGASSLQGALTVATGATLTASGSNTTFTGSATANMANANLYVSGGAALSLPGAVNCNDGAVQAVTVWQASGAGSLLSMTGLTNVAAPSDYPEVLMIQALAGGQVNLSGITTISGVVEVEAGGGGSEVNLSALQEFAGASDYSSAQLQTSAGGTILAGQLASLTDVSVVLGSGTLNLNTVTNLSYSTLSVTNGAVTLTNVVDIDNANLYVSGGAALSLPGVVNCNDAAEQVGMVWQASGAGSVLALTGLTNLAVPSDYPEVLTIQALAGGYVNLGGLSSISGVVEAQAGGSGSEINLSALQNFGGSSDYYSSQLQTSAGGTILSGQLGSLNGVSVVLGSGTLNLNAVTNLSYSTLTVTNGSVTLGNVTDIDNASFYVSGGATLSLPGVVNCVNIPNTTTVWQASGSGSVLALTGLTNLAAPYEGYNSGYAAQIQALAGGVVNLDGLVSISGIAQVQAGGSGSEVNLSALQNFNSDYIFSQLQPSNGGTILAGQLGSLTEVSIVLGSGTLNLNGVTNLSYSTLTVTNGSVTLGNVTDIDNASFYINGGATLSLPGVVNCVDIPNTTTVWQASGSGSVLALTSLTNLAAPYEGYNSTYAAQIQALAGGVVNLDGLVSISGIAQVQAGGSGSEVNLSALQNFNSDYIFSQLQPSAGGTILAGQLGSLTEVSIVLGGGTLNLNGVTNLSYSTLTVTNGSVTLGNVTDIDNASFYVSGGATLSLPGVVNCVDIPNTITVWQASGSGSVLALTSLTNLAAPYEGYNSTYAAQIQALAGGVVNLDGLVSISGIAQVQAGGSGSEVNLSALQNFNSDYIFSQLQPSNGGTILAGRLGSLTWVNMVLGGNGTLNLNGVTNLSYSTLTVTNGSLTLPNVTDIDNASFYVSGGATLSLPGVVNCVNIPNITTVWQASGSGSVLAMTGLTNVAAPYESYNGGYAVQIQALAGGVVNLDGLISISGIAQAQSGGSGSELNLSALQNFNSAYTYSLLQPTNGGTILAGQLENLTSVNVALGGGTLNLNTVTNLSYSTVTLTNGTVTLSNMADIDNASFYISNGATLSLPGVLNCVDIPNITTVWQAGGAGSVLSMNGLTNVAAPYESYNGGYAVDIQALAGGVVNLDGLVSISGIAQVQAGGSASEINLPALQNFDSDYIYSLLQPSNGGTILAGQLGSLTYVNVALGGGTLNLSAVTNLSYTTLTATNGSVTLNNVVNIDNASFYVSGGATLSLPGVMNCVDIPNITTVWQASGSGSVLALTSLTNVVAPYEGYNPSFALLIEALAGGDVNLQSLVSIPSGIVQVVSSNSGSQVDLQKLINYQTANALLNATNGGVIVQAQPKLTITANSTNMTYGGAVPALSVSYSGFLNGDTPASLAVAPSVSTAATSLSHAGTYPITVSGAVDTNYTIVFEPGVLTINPAPLTITASNASKTYGQTAALSSTAFSAAGLLDGDTIPGVTLTSAGAAATAAVGSYAIAATNASGPRAGNYAITYHNGTLTVNPATLTITANNASKYFGKTLTFAGTEFTASGLQNSNTVGSVTLASAGAVSTATVAGSPYSIMPSAATGGTFAPANYSIHYANGSLTVLPVGAPPTISSVLPVAGPNTGGTTVTINGAGFEPGATVTFGSAPGTSVTFESSNVLTAVSPAASSGTVGVSVTNPDGNSVTDNNAFVFGNAPDITSPPASLTLEPGQTAQFQVHATGDAKLAYQWQFDGTNLGNNSRIAGATTSSLTISNVGIADDGYYRCVVTNLYESVTSAAAVLSVVSPPSTVTVTPPSQSVGLGGSATFTATAGGTAPFSYFWYQNGSPLAGQTNSVLDIASAQANASYTVVVSNASGSVTSAPVTLTLLGYCASGQSTQATYPEGTNFIPINVTTYNCGTSAPVPNSAAVVWLSIDGTTRNLPVTTDGSGNGTAYFTPLPVEVGLVKYGFGLPGQAEPAPVGSFTIIGMNLSAQSEAPNLVVNAPQTNTLLLNNLTAVPLTGITASVLGAPPNVNVQVSVPSSLPGNGAIQTTYILQATGTVPAQAQFFITYTSAQGATVTLPVSATISPPTAQLATTPPTLIGAMVDGNQTLVTFTLTNYGGAPSGPLQINLPSAPWLSAVTAQPIPSLAPGQSGQIMLSLTPTNGQALGEYPGDLVILGSNTSLTVPFVFTAVSSLKGNLQVTVQDELTLYGAGNPNVSNATVTVTDFLTGTNVGTQVTGPSGVVTFSNLTSAYYTVTAEAPDHGNFSTTLLLQGNTTTPVTAFLALQLVNYTWTVTPTTIPDTYDFTLTTIFVTEVPWPEVAVTPIDLCSLTNCTNQLDLVVTNSGLIAAEGLQLLIYNANSNWSFVTLATNLGNLAAESSITVPVALVRNGCDTNPCLPSGIEASLFWYVAALNGAQYNNTPIFIYDSCCPNYGSAPVGYVVGGPVTGSGAPVVTQPVNYTTQQPGAVVNVTLQIDQTAILTANAFHATLNLANNAGSPVTDVQVNITPVDTNGNPVTNAFFIQTPILTGINAVDGTGTLGAGASASANWTIIPTTNAAPLGTSNYGIGGSISYVLDGEPVTIPLFAVPITVLPEPQLYLDYFLQHDVYSQDPFTSVIEPPIPFALGLRVRNLGAGVADNFTITSAQPVIINNANGLLINFQIIGSDVGSNATPVPSLTLDMGNIDPGTNVEGIWWMTASLEGDFTNFVATFQHLDALGGQETSVVNSVKIHEMNHVVEITCPSDDGLPDFLCNDTTNVDALPDDVYSSDGNVYPVTSLTGAVASGGFAGLNSTITVSDQADNIPSGFVYFQLVDPSGGQYAITSVKRSDGTELLAGTNVWQTPYRPHMVPPQLNNLIHIFDCNSTGSYAVTYGSAVIAPAASTLGAANVSPTNLTLVGIVNPESGTTEYYFQWGLTTNYGNFTPTNTLTANLGSAQEVTAFLGSLSPSTSIHYRVVAANVAGTTYGADQSVGTPALPVPVIAQVPNQSLIVGQTLVITNTAVAATPPVTFSLSAPVPEGAAITTNGVFTWTPSCPQGSTTNVITVWATDSGTPALSNAMTFVITVSECVQLQVGSAVLQAGQSGSVPVSLFSTVGITNLSFEISAPANRFTNWTITSSNSAIASATAQNAGPAPLFTLTTQPGQTLPSPSLLGSIGFTTLPGNSGFIPVAAANILGFKSDGTGVGNVTSQPGQITIIGEHPLLSATHGSNSTLILTLYGNPGSNYQMAFSTNLASTNWQTGSAVLLTNLQTNITINPTGTQMYFRLQ